MAPYRVRRTGALASGPPCWFIDIIPHTRAYTHSSTYKRTNTHSQTRARLTWYPLIDSFSLSPFLSLSLSPSAVVIGDVVCVWGGSGYGVDEALYFLDASENVWYKVDAANAPPTRAHHTLNGKFSCLVGL